MSDTDFSKPNTKKEHSGTVNWNAIMIEQLRKKKEEVLDYVDASLAYGLEEFLGSLDNLCRAKLKDAEVPQEKAKLTKILGSIHSWRKEKKEMTMKDAIALLGEWGFSLSVVDKRDPEKEAAALALLEDD